MTCNLKFIMSLMITVVVCSGFTVDNVQKSPLGNDSTKAFVYRNHYYGYCNGNKVGQVYDGYISLPSRIIKIEKKLDNFYYDQVFNELFTPYVMYRYTDDKGNVIIPLIHNSVTAADLTVDIGEFGNCPGFNWE